MDAQRLIPDVVINFICGFRVYATGEPDKDTDAREIAGGLE
jgi:hypothetical protein